jgi:hypothetical protein
LPASKRLVETTAKTPPTDRYNPCRLRIVLRNRPRMGAGAAGAKAAGAKRA